jgi:hypothetical protein
MISYYKEKLEQGLAYQDFVDNELYNVGLPVVNFGSRNYQQKVGENRAGIEIKYDARFRETGKFYIEVAEKADPNNPSFVMSGIYRQDNSWLYLIGDYQSIFIFSKLQLQKIHKRYKEVEISTSKGFLLPVDYAIRCGLVILKLQPGVEW